MRRRVEVDEWHVAPVRNSARSIGASSASSKPPPAFALRSVINMSADDADSALPGFHLLDLACEAVRPR